MKTLRRFLIAALAAIAGTASALAIPVGLPGGPAAAGAFPLGPGYWLVLDDGSVGGFGDAQNYGSPFGTTLSSPVVGMAPLPVLEGYWLVAADGGIFNYGAAGFHGSLGDLELNAPIVGMAATPTGQGYWMVASDGGVFAFGDAEFLGSEGGGPLNKPIVGMAATPSGKGYWLVASDGGIFTHGDAEFFGSEGSLALNKPIVAMASSATGKGYYLVASDGGLFTHGDAVFRGSEGDLRLNSPIVGMVLSATGNGYTFVARDGGVFTHGDAPFLGSTGDARVRRPVVGIAPRPPLQLTVTPFADAQIAIARWVANETGDQRLRMIYLTGDSPAGARVTGVEGIDVSQLGTVSVRKYSGTCLRFVLVYRSAADTENQRRDFTCEDGYVEGPTLTFRPADVVPGDARVLAFQIWNSASALLRDGVAEIDDIQVAGVTISGPGVVRLI